ncbi:MAG: glycoside hydrolase family 5 protein [Planctomycetaceae bacterium]|jgi:hypothetical protein|nr:glycoside hydrolase family 5 protein [Planctomycetaceae bacterium]
MRNNISRRDFLALSGTAVLAASASQLFADDKTDDLKAFVRVSQRYPRYFELDNGKPYIPIGINMTCPPQGDDDSLTKLENDWFKKLHANRANFIRIWLSHQQYEVEREKPGNMDSARAKRLDKLFALARKYGIRLKLCTEHFRNFGEGNQRWADRSMYLKKNGGMAEDFRDYFLGEAGREHYKKKLQWYANRYGNDPIVFGWELWNEMNSIYYSNAIWRKWTAEMLPELHRLFPKNLAMQSLGSFDRESAKKMYEDLCRMPGNDVLQVHRYLDLGAEWNICHAPVAELSAEAVKELLGQNVPKPVLLAEGGAVEPKHIGPSKLYEKDKAGIILHDVLFAPFFVGAAGSGHCWHWDIYVHKNDLWHHFDRFASVVEGLDPIAEELKPFEIPHDRLYLYGLKGKNKMLIWCRDKENTWKTELEEGKSPESLSGLELDLSKTEFLFNGKKIAVYDPWENRQIETKTINTKVVLPSFRRSVVLTVS